jgi:hypothetical protein
VLLLLPPKEDLFPCANDDGEVKSQSMRYLFSELYCEDMIEKPEIFFPCFQKPAKFFSFDLQTLLKGESVSLSSRASNAFLYQVIG